MKTKIFRNIVLNSLFILQANQLEKTELKSVVDDHVIKLNPKASEVKGKPYIFKWVPSYKVYELATYFGRIPISLPKMRRELNRLYSLGIIDKRTVPGGCNSYSIDIPGYSSDYSDHYFVKMT